jgi:hypothetical protein
MPRDRLSRGPRSHDTRIPVAGRQPPLAFSTPVRMLNSLDGTLLSLERAPSGAQIEIVG